MIKVSKQYKEIMDRPIRNRASISVGIGVVNQEAQRNAKVSGELAYWSKGDVFSRKITPDVYATLEENFFAADGTMLFMPEDNELMQLTTNGLATNTFLGELRIELAQTYEIKGLTIDFGNGYPTEFEIRTSEKSMVYQNSKSIFETTDVMGKTNYISIVPLTMVGGWQRLRVRSIVLGVGLEFSDHETQSSSLKEFVSSISDELPSNKFSLTVFDEDDIFDVDDENSFIGFLETMQEVRVSYGLELDDGSMEWHQAANLFLKDWNYKKGSMTFTATDRFSHMADKYHGGNKIYNRSAYAEAISILTDAGLTEDQYIVDEFLRDIVLENPMPVTSHKECLQILANACRCILMQNEQGKIVMRANFATVLRPDDLRIETDSEAAWSKPENLPDGGNCVYADLTENFFTADGTMFFMPENASYLETAYVSEEISDENGMFAVNPSFSIILPAAHSYYGINVMFDGNAPLEVVAHTFYSGSLIESVTFDGITKDGTLFYEFSAFDKITLEFTKTVPHNRVLVNKASFGDVSDYILRKQDMLDYPQGYREEKIRGVQVKVFRYENNDKGEPKEVEDSVYVEKIINVSGTVRTCENPLVSTQAHAALLSEWLGNYYANNISYDVSFRGEPRLNAVDIIRMESDVLSNLQVEITEADLTYDGTYNGTLALRRALKIIGG